MCSTYPVSPESCASTLCLHTSEEWKMAEFRENQQQYSLHSLGGNLNRNMENEITTKQTRCYNYTNMGQGYKIYSSRFNSSLTNTYPKGLSVSMHRSLQWSEKRTSFSLLFIMELTSWSLDDASKQRNVIK